MNVSMSFAVVMAAAGLAGQVSAGLADQTPVPPVTRVEVVLAKQYQQNSAPVKEDFAQAGMTNVHLQFARMGQPPPNIGMGRDVPADKAREAIRLALKYNRDVTILLPERLFPPRFVTIASSNFDDTVEFPIDHASLVQLQDERLSTEEFHALYRRLTTPKDTGGRY